MKKTALVIMAAGIGSRFGKGIKQLAPVGPNGEIIMDYSIHDALEAGFNKVVFIIRKDLEEEFRRVIGERIEKITEVEYAFQSLENLPDGFSKPADRTKPWGTGQEVLAARENFQQVAQSRGEPVRLCLQRRRSSRLRLSSSMQTITMERKHM